MLVEMELLGFVEIDFGIEEIEEDDSDFDDDDEDDEDDEDDVFDGVGFGFYMLLVF